MALVSVTMHLPVPILYLLLQLPFAVLHACSSIDAYASSPIIYSPNGRVLQLEFAREVVRKGEPLVGIRGKDGLVVMTRTTSLRKFEMVDDHIVLGTAGLAADAAVFAKTAKKICSSYREDFGAPIAVENLSDQLATLLHAQTRRAGTRPLGIGALVAGADDVLGPQLYTIGTQGRFEGWKAVAIGGPGQDQANDLLAASVGRLHDKSVEDIVLELQRDSCRLLASFFKKTVAQAAGPRQIGGGSALETKPGAEETGTGADDKTQVQIYTYVLSGDKGYIWAAKQVEFVPADKR